MYSDFFCIIFVPMNRMIDKISKIYKSRVLVKGTILREDTSSISSELYLVLEDHLISSKEWVVVFKIGTISKNFENQLYASFILNTKISNKFKIRYNSDDFISYRLLKQNEIDLIKNALSENIYQTYLDIIYKNTEIDIRKINF